VLGEPWSTSGTALFIGPDDPVHRVESACISAQSLPGSFGTRAGACFFGPPGAEPGALLSNGASPYGTFARLGAKSSSCLRKGAFDREGAASRMRGLSVKAHSSLKYQVRGRATGRQAIRVTIDGVLRSEARRDGAPSVRQCCCVRRDSRSAPTLKGERYLQVVRHGKSASRVGRHVQSARGALPAAEESPTRQLFT